MQNNILKGFIVLEGIDGSGTTTQVSLLKEYFTSFGKTALATCEPTEMETGLFLRKCLSKKISVEPETMPFLFAADRAEHLYGKNGIIASLKNFDYVISDRYLFSSLAYQGATGFFSLAQKLNEDFPLPEVLLYFDVDSKKAFSRVENRGSEKEIYEVLSFQEKVYNEYEKVLKMLQNSCMRIIRINANNSKEDVFNQIKDSLNITIVK